MSAEIIDFNRQRALRMMERQRARQEAFDRELTRRLMLFLNGAPLPAEPIADNPYR